MIFSLSFHVDNVYNDTIMFWSTFILDGEVVSDINVDEVIIKKSLKFINEITVTKIELYKDNFGYKIVGEITQNKADKLIYILEDLE